MSDFPVLDASRLKATNNLSRIIADTFGEVEPYIEDTDSFIAMPLRLVHDQAAGWHLELGPYDLDAADLYRLRRAIAAYHEAVGPLTKEAPE